MDDASRFIEELREEERQGKLKTPCRNERITITKASNTETSSCNSDITADYPGNLLTINKINHECKMKDDKSQEDNHLLEHVFNAITDGISILDKDLNIIKTNRYMKQLYSQHLPLIGKKCYQVYQQRETPCPWCPSIHTLKTGEVNNEIVPYPDEKDPKGWLSLTSYLLTDDDNCGYGIIEYVKDITGEKSYEKKISDEKQFIESILKSLPGIFCLFDQNGHFLRWNKNFENVTEYTSNEIDNITAIDLFEDKIKITAAITQAFETGKAELQGSLLTKNAKKIPCFFTGIRITYQNETLIAGIGTDLTYITEVEFELNKRIKELEMVENLAVNRELKMIELKKEINNLLQEQGKLGKYDISKLEEE